jgi:hypothetical protein
MVSFQNQYTRLQYQQKLSAREREIPGGEKVIQDLVTVDRVLVAGMPLRFSSFKPTLANRLDPPIPMITRMRVAQSILMSTPTNTSMITGTKTSMSIRKPAIRIFTPTSIEKSMGLMIMPIRGMK